MVSREEEESGCFDASTDFEVDSTFNTEQSTGAILIICVLLNLKIHNSALAVDAVHEHLARFLTLAIYSWQSSGYYSTFVKRMPSIIQKLCRQGVSQRTINVQDLNEHRKCLSNVVLNVSTTRTTEVGQLLYVRY